MRRRGGARPDQGTDALHFHRDDPVEVLKHAFQQQEGLADQNRAVGLELVRRDDRIGDPCFVFEAQEEESLGCAGALAADDASGDADGASVRQPLSQVIIPGNQTNSPPAVYDSNLFINKALLC
jgi:hypothetical protein